MDRMVELSYLSGDIVMSGDGFSDRKRTSIVSVLVFTPTPLYIHTGLWPEQRHTAVNTFNLFSKHINKLGSRNVFGFVPDTEPKMQSVWARLQEQYPWLVVVPCAAHVFDLLFKDITKHASFSEVSKFCITISQLFRKRHLPKAILERIQVQEYQSVQQLQRTGASQWKSELIVVEAVLKSQTALQKTVVDNEFKTQVMTDKDPRARQAAAEVSEYVKNDALWEKAKLYAALMRPVTKALDAGQGDVPGVGAVYTSFLRLQKHFTNFFCSQLTSGGRC